MASRKNKWILSSAFILCAASAQAATLTVPAQYGTIQAAIDAAQPGDVVLLSDGTYTGTGNVNLDYGGKSITVTSVNGAARTIIDCQYQSGGSFVSGVLFHTGETAAAKLQGVTIENGLNYHGGGVSISGGSSTAAGASPTLNGCAFVNNSAQTGGGVYASGFTHPTFANCVFLHNSAEETGGGLYAYQTTLTGCTFTENTTARSDGGGAYLDPLATNTDRVVTNCIFDGNQANGSGGGVYDFSQPVDVFLNCVFVGNRAAAAAAVGGGGGFYGLGIFTNCTFTGNAALSGAAADLFSGSITNCVLFGDTGSAEANHSANIPVTFSDVQNGSAGQGNINVDPGFVRAPNLTAMPADYGDLRLRSTSPMIRAGTAASAPTVDITGALRPVPPSIGAYEIGPALVPVVADSAVLSSAPTQNFGSAPTLTVGGFLGAAYLQFDTSLLTPLTAGSTVKLRFSARRLQGGIASLAVSPVGTNWTETGLSFSNRPLLGAPTGVASIIGGQPSAPYNVDVTSYVKAQQALGITQIGLAVTQLVPGSPVSIDSKENAANDGPQLVVTY